MRYAKLRALWLAAFVLRGQPQQEKPLAFDAASIKPHREDVGPNPRMTKKGASTPSPQGGFLYFRPGMVVSGRFHLVVHRQKESLAVYTIVLPKNGTKLHEWKEGERMPAPAENHAMNYRGAGTMEDLAAFLSSDPHVGRLVLDRTGLQGRYVYTFWVGRGRGVFVVHARSTRIEASKEQSSGGHTCNRSC